MDDEQAVADMTARFQALVDIWNGARGAVTIVAAVNGVDVGRWVMPKDDSSLAVTVPLPEGLDRTKPVRVEVRITPVLREPGPGGRELGLAFGKIGLR